MVHCIVMETIRISVLVRVSIVFFCRVASVQY